MGREITVCFKLKSKALDGLILRPFGTSLSSFISWFLRRQIIKILKKDSSSIGQLACPFYLTSSTPGAYIRTSDTTSLHTPSHA